MTKNNTSKRFLKLAIIFKAGGLNYGESIGNISPLKRINIDKKRYIRASNNSIKYDIKRIMTDDGGLKYGNVDKNQKTVQFSKDTTIENSSIFDIFGGMKTEKKQNATIRKSVIVVTDAISLNESNDEYDFGTNIGMLNKTGKAEDTPDLRNTEIGSYYYKYEIVLNLTNVGIDDQINLFNAEKYNRVHILVESIRTLNKVVRGRPHCMSPIFIIGGLYDNNSFYFNDKVELLDTESDMISINSFKLNELLKKRLFNSNKIISETTSVASESDVQYDLNCKKYDDIDSLFRNIDDEIKKYYGV